MAHVSQSSGKYRRNDLISLWMYLRSQDRSLLPVTLLSAFRTCGGISFSSVRNICSAVLRNGMTFCLSRSRFDPDGAARFVVTSKRDGLKVAVPHLPHGTDVTAIDALMRQLLDRLIQEQSIENFVSWYYTPMMLGWSEQLNPAAVVYDCMDELSAFKNAPPRCEFARRSCSGWLILSSPAGEVFTRRNVNYTTPSIVSRRASTRTFCSCTGSEEPADQAGIPRPRIGFFGVIDERTDIDL